jgi:hypothetical protein
MMMKSILILLAVVLAVPNFIHKDIIGESVYNQKERFVPGLTSIQTVDHLEQYIDRAAAMKQIKPGSEAYTALIAYIISCRFYHGFSHWKLNENWVAAVGEKIFGYGLSCKVQPEDIMKHPYAASSQQALVMMELLGRKKVPYRKAGFPHHYALEVMHHGNWYFFDPNMKPHISMAQRAHSNWKGYNDNLKPFYDTAIHPNLSYQFGNGQMAHFGPVNEVPARNARLFQGVTGFLSKCLWCLPVIVVFSRKKKPYMYAVKPVNKNFTPVEPLRPLYYA